MPTRHNRRRVQSNLGIDRFLEEKIKQFAWNNAGLFEVFLSACPEHGSTLRITHYNIAIND